MTLAILLSLLAHDEYAAREHAERALRTRPYETLRLATAQCFDPEARPRLQRLTARALCRAVDSLLPDDRPFWPDRDHFRIFAPVEYREKLDGTPVGHKYPRFMPNAYVEYRRRAKSFIVWYIRETGDWCGAEHMVLQASDSEARSTRYATDTQTDEALFWQIWFSAPELLKGNWR